MRSRIVKWGLLIAGIGVVIWGVVFAIRPLLWRPDFEVDLISARVLEHSDVGSKERRAVVEWKIDYGSNSNIPYLGMDFRMKNDPSELSPPLEVSSLTNAAKQTLPISGKLYQTEVAWYYYNDDVDGAEIQFSSPYWRKMTKPEARLTEWVSSVFPNAGQKLSMYFSRVEKAGFRETEWLSLSSPKKLKLH